MMQPRFDCSHRATKDLGNLLVTELLGVTEHQGLALGLGKLRDGAPEGALPFLGQHPPLGAFVTAVLWIERQPAQATPPKAAGRPQATAVLIEENCIEPGADAVISR